MYSFLLWYLLISIVGWIAFPISYRLFSGLRDRGYGFSKILGLLLWSFLFWLLNILHIGQNSPAGMLLALLLVVAGSYFSMRRGNFSNLLAWIKSTPRMVIFTELLFLSLFAFWTFIRSTNPDIIGTEKPMELAFINSILRSSQFPPRDPWLSGYAISYYYFGYVMIAMLVKMTGVASWVGFNLAVGLWFALSGVGAFSLILSLISKRSQSTISPAPEHGDTERVLPDLLWSLLGPLFLLILSNIEGFLEMLHARGIFWRQGSDGVWQSRFWKWLDIQELVQPPAMPFSWAPERPAGIWWWRASRVLQDYTAMGQSKEVIDEFPFFSFLLSDLHPHVLAIPFALLAIGFALHFYRRYTPPPTSGISLFASVQRWISGEPVKWNEIHFFHLFLRWDFWVLSFLCGALAFLNTWDFPIYVGLFAAVFGYRRYQKYGWNFRRFFEFIGFGLLTGITGVLFYLPFYVGFSSQAGGFLPSLFFFTRGIHFWVMFLPLLFPIFIWLCAQVIRHRRQYSLQKGLLFTSIILFGLFTASYFLGGLAVSLPVLGANWVNSSNSLLVRFAAPLQNLGGLFYSVQGISQPSDIFHSILLRLAQPGTWITLSILIILVWGLLSIRTQESDSPFLLLLILLGTGLVLFPEFFYLRDQFGWRINTIFKFYYQAWIIWSVAAAAGTVMLFKKLALLPRMLFSFAGLTVLLMGIAYPFWGIQMKLDQLRIEELSLNGARHIEQASEEEMRAIEWLLDAPDGIVLEAVGGSYSGYARISTYTGLPTVLGWPGHESQWRGGSTEMGTREADIRQIYQSSNWEETKALLQFYDVRYIYIGGYERSAYRVNENKFTQFLSPVFAGDNVRIFEFMPITTQEERIP